MTKKTRNNVGNIVEIQNILTDMAIEVYNANTAMKKTELALMFRKADSLRDMAKYVVAAQNAMQNTNSCLTFDSSCLPVDTSGE